MTAITPDEYAELLRAHTRAIWALKGEVEYPEDEMVEMGRRAGKILSRARAAAEDHPKEENA